MTVNTATSTATYTGNGATTAFAVPFYFLVNTDLQVLQKIGATGVVKTLVLNSDYTLTGAGVGAGGSLTMTVAPAGGATPDTLYIQRNVAAVQQTAYPANSPFPAASHEMALDRLTMLAQQIQTGLGLTLQKQPLASIYDLQGNTLINEAVAVNPADVPNLSQVQTMVTGAASGLLPADIQTKSGLALPAGSTGVGFQQNGAGSVPRTVQAKDREVEISITDFGADPTGVADCSAAWAAAQASLPLTGGTIAFPAGVFRFTSTIIVGNAPAQYLSTLNGVRIKGRGQGRDTIRMTANDAATRIVWDGAVGGTLLRVQGPISGISIEDVQLDGNGKAAILIDSMRSFLQTVRNVHGVRWLNGYAIAINADSTLVSGGGSAPCQQLWEMVTLADPGVGANSVQIGRGAGNLNQLTFVRCYFDRYNATTTVGLSLGYCDHLSFFGCHFGMTGSSGATGIGIQIDSQAPNTSFPWNINLYTTSIAGGIADTGVWNNNYYPALTFWPFFVADGQPLPPAGANSTTLNPNLVRGYTDIGQSISWNAETNESVTAAATIAPKHDTILLSGSSVTINTITPPRLTGLALGGWRLTIIPSGASLAFGTSGNIAEAFSLSNYRAVMLVYSEGTGKWHRVAG